MAHFSTLCFSAIIFTAIIFLQSNAAPSSSEHPPHGPPKDLPPGFSTVLPPGVVIKLRAIYQDDSLSWKQKHEKIDKIMDTVPQSILKKLPLPPFFDRLPADVKEKLVAIHKQEGLSWHQKHEKIHEFIKSLPESTRRLIPPPPHPRR